MPSSVLHDQIFHSVLLPNQPLFCLPPRVFGCVCFVHILCPRQDKLSTKATKGVFLGILAFKGIIVVILPTLIATSFLLMLPSLRIPLSSPL